MYRNENLKNIIKSSIEKFSQTEELISLIDKLLKNNSGEQYNLLDVAINKTISPLQALIQNKHYFDLKNLYPNMVWSSIFLTIYSTFEHTLNEICKSLQNKNGNNIYLKDLKHKGITRSQFYLKKVIQIKFPDETKEWAFIKNSNEVRNCIIHEAGNFHDCNKNNGIIKFIENTKSLGEMDDKIVMKKEFSEEFINGSKIIIDLLAKSIDYKFNNK